ncbi:MAG TPA: adenylate/guanylate cyclase domain-containing protein [Gaiellaceae bacterium]|nr:adenylate/guanylate cyclase domain-containing protein [Gaiellaceae bacterium]
MDGAPEVRFARSGDVSVAFQTVGDGPLDLVLAHGWVCSFNPGWEWPALARFYRRLAGLGRLILFDKRGTGLSDRVAQIPTLEERMDDVRAVMDAAGSERAALVGVSEGGPMCALFAATYPERTAALVGIGTYARRMWAPDYPIGFTTPSPWHEPRPEDWGVPAARVFLAERAPSVAGDERAVRWYASYLVRGASPRAAAQLAAMNRDIDVRGVLPSVRVPTLVLFREGEYLRHASRYLGEHVAGARVVELPGDDHLPWEGDQDSVVGEIERFIGAVQAEIALDRVLVTVLFTDVVGSTERAAELGDSRWRELLDRHDAIAAGHVARFRGRLVKTTGDGLLATFDGPARAVRCAQAIAADVRELGLAIRAGVHTGEVELRGDDVGGLAVHIGARIAALAGAGEVLVSRTVTDLVAGSGLAFGDRGEHELKGVPGRWQLFAAGP